MTLGKWTISASRQVAKDRWISLRADRCLTPEGEVVDPFYVLEYPTWINVVPLTDDDEVILVRQYRHGLGRVCLGLPSGTVDSEDAGPEAAARRELLEETGYGGGQFTEIGVLSPNPANHTNLTHCFLAQGVKVMSRLVADPTEIIETRLIPLADLAGLVQRGELIQSLHVGSIFFALAKLGKI